MMRCVRFFAVTALIVGLLGIAANADVLKKTATGKPAIKSINVIEFAPEGVLLVGDGAGSQIFAVQTGDTKPAGTLADAITGIDAKLAGPLGTTPKGIEIIDLAVNPASGKAYVAVRKQDDKQYVILTISGSGKISEFELDNVTYARVQLTVPGRARISNITDVAWAEDRLIAAGRSNESFSSKIFSVNAPLSHESKGSSYSAETYHVSHRRWETRAPMSVVLPLKQDGKTYVVGAFSCTPIVKYPLDALESGAKVKGQSVIELGSGNRPLDMLVYEKGGKAYVLANTFRFHHKRKPFGPSPYWTVKFEQDLLSQNKNINETAVRRLKGDKPATDRIQMVEAYHGVMQMAKLDAKRALVLKQTDAGLTLQPLPLP